MYIPNLNMSGSKVTEIFKNNILTIYYFRNTIFIPISVFDVLKSINIVKR